jgi:hypothetical protein
MDEKMKKEFSRIMYRLTKLAAMDSFVLFIEDDCDSNMEDWKKIREIWKRITVLERMFDLFRIALGLIAGFCIGSYLALKLVRIKLQHCAEEILPQVVSDAPYCQGARQTLEFMFRMFGLRVK